MVRKLKRRAGWLSVLGKVTHVSQEVMGSTVSVSKGDLEELDFGGAFGWPQRNYHLGQALGKGGCFC